MRLLASDMLIDQFGGRMRALAPRIEFIRLNGDGSADGQIDQAEVICITADMFARNSYVPVMRAMPQMTTLRWFHGSFVGMDHPIFRSIAERGVTVTNSPGVTAQPIAQYVLAMMLRHAKRIPEWERAQRERAWRRVESDELTGRTVVVIGVGGIGREVARLCKAFGMRVLGIRRSPGTLPDIDRLEPPTRLHDALGEADYVVVSCPLTEETRGMLDAAALARLRPEAYLINVARGPIVDEAALVDALRSRRIAGAALDVFDKEPLPAESPLWELENVIITPHNSAASPYTFQRGALVFLENLRRYAAGESLLNVVDFGNGTG